jgi:hypothetical protein
MNASVIFDFNSEANIYNWKIVDDVVMGGKSNGNFNLNEDGFGHFWGEVSLENNGGFSSVRYRFKSKKLTSKTKIVLTVKGDKKTYQFRLKNKRRNYYSYIYNFNTNGEWQTIEFLLSDLSPSFRGRKLNQKNFNHNQIEELAFLIANKKNENFNLLIDKIELK